MSWSAFAYLGNQAVFKLPENHPVRVAFKRANDFVVGKTGISNSELYKGMLFLSACGKQLEFATNQDVYDNYGWSADKVASLNVVAIWNFNEEEIQGDEVWVYWSARLFLETCAEQGCQIQFSF